MTAAPLSARASEQTSQTARWLRPAGASFNHVPR